MDTYRHYLTLSQTWLYCNIAQCWSNRVLDQRYWVFSWEIQVLHRNRHIVPNTEDTGHWDCTYNKQAPMQTLYKHMSIYFVSFKAVISCFKKRIIMYFKTYSCGLHKFLMLYLGLNSSFIHHFIIFFFFSLWHL